MLKHFWNRSKSSTRPSATSTSAGGTSAAVFKLTTRAVAVAALLAGSSILTACPEVEGIDNIPDAGSVEPATDAGNREPEPTPEPDDECPAFPVAGIEVVVLDSNGDRLCDAFVVVAEGTFEETLQTNDPGGPQCSFFGVFERAGTYDVTASAPGYLSATEAAVVVSLDACGDARTQSLEQVLAAGEDPPVDAGPQPDPEPTPEPAPSPSPEPDPDPPPLVCPDGLEVAAGDVTLSSEQDLADFQAIECVEGTLRLTSTAFTDAVANNLVAVGRDLLIDGAPNLETVAFAGLTDVGRDVVVEDCEGLLELDLDAIANVGAGLTLGKPGSGLPALTDLDLFSGLTQVGTDLTIEETGVQSLNQNFASLDTLTGIFVLIGNVDLVDVRFANQISSFGGMVVQGNPALESIRLRDVASGFSRLETTDNAVLATYDFRGLEVVAGDVVIDQCDFSDGDFRDLTSISGDLIVTNTNVDQIDGALPALETVAGTLAVTNNPNQPTQDVVDWADGITSANTQICDNENGDPCI